MNITPHIPTIPIATANNPATDTLRRENNLREVITQPAATAQSAGEKGVGSEKDRSKTPAQTNEQVDFIALRKRAEEEMSTISDGSDRGQEDKPPSDSSRQDVPEQNTQAEEKSIDEFAEEQKIIELKQRDAEVRTHESAHAAIGGAATGAPS